MATPSTADEHFARLTKLLELESHAQARRAAEEAKRFTGAEAERTGNTLVDLTIADEDAGLGGRYILTLVKRRRGALPWTRLDVGSPVMLSPDVDQLKRRSAGYGNSANNANSFRGVICQRGEHGLAVALAQLPEEMGDIETWRVDLAGDDVAAQRQRIALSRAKNARANRLAQLRDVLLGVKPPNFDADKDESPLDEGLNETQLQAVRLALAARDVALIHGPPGTGKTTTVVELIRRAVRRGQTVLACAPSNLAVDNMLERLLAAGEKAVRLGHPARVLPQLRASTLDLLVEEHEDVRLSHKLIKDAMRLFRRADRYTRAKPAPGEKREMRQEAKRLIEDARRLENQAVEHILDQADVLCATTTALDDSLLGDRRFDLAVIDEACQSTEPGCWIPLARCEKIVLAGDHCQLPPTILSKEAGEQGFGISLFERLIKLHAKPIGIPSGTVPILRGASSAGLSPSKMGLSPSPGRYSQLLTVQYRMHEAIMDFSSREFYDGQLSAAPAVQKHLLHDLPHVAQSPLTESPVEFIDTAGAGYDEELEPDGESRRNPQEAELTVRKVRALLAGGLEPREIAVISPYAAQVRLLRELMQSIGRSGLWPDNSGSSGQRPDLRGLEIDSVDGFQGREKEAIVISHVRSNAECEIGFLGELRRMNVALTRARRKLLIIGDSATLGAHPFYARLLEYCERIGGYRTVWEEPVE